MRRHDGGEGLDDRRPHGGGDVGRTGVAADHDVGAGEEVGQVGERGGTGAVVHPIADRIDADALGEVALGGATGDQDQPPRPGEAADGLGRAVQRQLPGGHRCAGVDHDVGLARDVDSRRRQAQRERPVVTVGEPAPGGGAHRQRLFDLVEVVEVGVSHIEERSGVVDRGGGDVSDAGHAQEERERQRALVEGGEHDRCIHPGGCDPIDQRLRGVPVDRWRVEADPGRLPRPHLVDAGEEVCRGRAGRAGEERDPVG